MNKADLTRYALELPIEEQLDLAQEIWEHASPSADFTLSDELKELLEARLLEARTNPEAGVPCVERDLDKAAASELGGLIETAHLLRSPRNAERLLTALQEARIQATKPQTAEDLRRKMGLGPGE